MKAYRILITGLVLLILGAFFTGCESRQERISKEEDLRARIQRMERLTRNLDELDVEISKMENTLKGLDDVMFKTKMSLANLKKAQQEINKTTSELKSQIIPIQTLKPGKSFHWFWTLLVLFLIVVAIYYFIKFYRSRKELEEETSLEEGIPFESSSPFEQEDEEIVDSEDDDRS